MIADIKKRANHRSKIIEGQFKGLNKMINDEVYCIDAQAKERNEMKTWQQQWNYGKSQEDSGSMMNMMH